ncbi:hypothetical protein [Streptomyces sp. NPDC000983]|uniref:hypothetical protein n=1 Tax=Streptomyces sp. NPDC000983 TaxID=3154373 RepID=UPI00331817AD
MTTIDPAPDEPDSAAVFGRAWNTLVPARAAYLEAVTPHYDEVLHDVARRAEESGSLGKADLAALVVWKRIDARTRWARELMSRADSEVRKVTERAVSAVREPDLTRGEAAKAGRAILAGLPGFRTGDALASAVLTAAAPSRMAVYDRHVQHTLDALGLTLTAAPGRYGRYLQLLDDLLRHGGDRADPWTARDVDTALYWSSAGPPVA